MPGAVHPDAKTPAGLPLDTEDLVARQERDASQHDPSTEYGTLDCEDVHAMDAIVDDTVVSDADLLARLALPRELERSAEQHLGTEYHDDMQDQDVEELSDSYGSQLKDLQDLSAKQGGDPKMEDDVRTEQHKNTWTEQETQMEQDAEAKHDKNTDDDNMQALGRRRIIRVRLDGGQASAAGHDGRLAWHECRAGHKHLT